MLLPFGVYGCDSHGNRLPAVKMWIEQHQDPTSTATNLQSKAATVTPEDFNLEEKISGKNPNFQTALTAASTATESRSFYIVSNQ